MRVIRALYNKTHWFSDEDAWKLFRLLAFLVALGWTLLIGAIIYRSNDLPGAAILVSISGRLHGVFFLLYFVFVLLTARSMAWGFWRISLALLAGVLPYTSLVFERIMAHHRRRYPVVVAQPVGYEEHR